MLIALASIKGSPGVTTFALALTAHWPGDTRRVLIECDPAGGDIAPRFGLTLTPGLISLAAEARRNPGVDGIWRHTQQLPGGLPVVVGPLRPDQARTALQALIDNESPGRRGANNLPSAVAGRCDLTVAADCGRLDPNSPALPIIRSADHVLILVQPRRDILSHLAARLPEIGRLASRVGLVLVGGGYSPAEVTGELDVPVFASVPDDRRGAALLAGGLSRPGRSRHGLSGAAAKIAMALTNLSPGSGPDAALIDTAGPPDCVAGEDEHPTSGTEPTNLLSAANGRLP